MHPRARLRPKTNQLEFSCALSTQRERDDESALMHYRARSYDPRTGRFVQKDPLLSGRIRDHFLLSELNPVTRRDPRGLQSDDERILRYRELHEAYKSLGSSSSDLTLARAFYTTAERYMYAARIRSWYLQRVAGTHYASFVKLGEFQDRLEATLFKITITWDPTLAKRKRYGEWDGVYNVLYLRDVIWKSSPETLFHELTHAVTDLYSGFTWISGKGYERWRQFAGAAHWSLTGIGQAFKRLEEAVSKIRGADKDSDEDNLEIARLTWGFIKDTLREMHAGTLEVEDRPGRINEEDIGQMRSYLGFRADRIKESELREFYSSMGGIWKEVVKD